MLTVPMEWETGWATELVLKVWRKDEFVAPARIRIADRQAQQSVDFSSSMDTRVFQPAVLTNC
jgi:hypothetical protein